MVFDFALIPVATYVFYGLFLAISIVNIVFAFIENNKLRKVTKPFCLLFLIIGTIIWVPTSFLLYLALIFDLLGDIVFIWKHKLKLFVLGSLFFFIGHIFLVAQGLCLFGKELPWIFYVVLIFFLIIFNLFAYFKMKNIVPHERLAILADIYLSILLLILFTMWGAVFNGFSNYILISALGSISFILSDLIIIYCKFVKKIHRQEFFIMSLYLLAQFMITVGFCMTISIL